MMRQQQRLDTQRIQQSENKAILENLQKQSILLQSKVRAQRKATTIKKRGEMLSKWLYHVAYALPKNASLLSLTYDQTTLKICGTISSNNDLEKYQNILSKLIGINSVTVDEIKPTHEALQFALTLTLDL